jgi:DNA (cytosine-5)-methyltransferase 1
VRFVDLCAGLGGFHVALSQLGHQCVFAAEIDDELRRCYRLNFPSFHGPLVGDLRKAIEDIPEHDILCAGFPCQPFSKCGSQAGFLDRTRGTLFYYILLSIARHRPTFVILENVGNFERHDGGRTWKTVREALESLGYHVRGTEHKSARGSGLLSPTDIGVPHSRGRFFIVASLKPFRFEPFPLTRSGNRQSLDTVLLPIDALSPLEIRNSALSFGQQHAIEIWNGIVRALPSAPGVLPSFPLWSYEWGARYPFENTTPSRLTAHELRGVLRLSKSNRSYTRSELLHFLPSYARTDEPRFPAWKQDFIRKNREWYRRYKDMIPRELRLQLRTLSSSFQKLEWNVKYGERNLWAHILQFRPSGIRVRAADAVPSLVAMTRTQVPIIGAQKRFLVPREGLALLGMPQTFALPELYPDSFRAIGNGVHAGVVESVARQLFRSASTAPHKALRPSAVRETIARIEELVHRHEAI